MVNGVLSCTPMINSGDKDNAGIFYLRKQEHFIFRPGIKALSMAACYLVHCIRGHDSVLGRQWLDILDTDGPVILNNDSLGYCANGVVIEIILVKFKPE